MRQSRWVRSSMAAVLLTGALSVIGAAAPASADEAYTCDNFPQGQAVQLGPARLGTEYSGYVGRPGWGTPGPYHYTSYPNEAPPTGLTLDDTGLLHGTPLVLGTYSWHIQVVDAGVPCTGNIVATITISNPPEADLVTQVADLLLRALQPGCLESVVRVLTGGGPPGSACL